MITSKKHLFLTCAVVAISFLFPACNKPSDPGVYKNEEIRSNVRNTLHGLQNDLLAALKSEDRHAQEFLMSKEYIDDVQARVKVWSEASIRMKKADYSLFQEYYLVSAIDTGDIVIKDRTSGLNNYDLAVPINAKEMYVAQFIAKKAPLSWMITATYQKTNYGWKIGAMEISPYSENHRTAPEQIAFAKQLTKKKYYLDANNAMVAAVNTLSPAEGWKYEKYDQVIKMAEEAGATIAAVHHLPIPVKQVDTDPLIWRVTIQYDNEGTFPNINYVSKLPLWTLLH